jgi:hypothetical protein
MNSGQMQSAEARGSRRSADPHSLSHPLFDRRQRRLREIVNVCMGSHDGMPLRDVLLSRVPTIGEEIAVEARIYRVIRVQHSTLDLDGRAALGTHAYVTVVEVPDVGYLKRPASPIPRRSRTKKSPKKPAVE